jgi:hypothetical protein
MIGRIIFTDYKIIRKRRRAFVGVEETGESAKKLPTLP